MSADPSVLSGASLSRRVFRLEYLVEHADTDDSRVMHFARYPSLAETAVLLGFDVLGIGLNTLRADGQDVVVSQLRVDYLAPARFLDKLEVTARPAHVGAVQCRMSAAIRRIGDGDDAPRSLAGIELVMGVLDIGSGKPTRLPTRMREVLSAMTESELGDD